MGRETLQSSNLYLLLISIYIMLHIFFVRTETPVDHYCFSLWCVQWQQKGSAAITKQIIPAFKVSVLCSYSHMCCFCHYDDKRHNYVPTAALYITMMILLYTALFKRISTCFSFTLFTLPLHQYSIIS